MRPIYISQLDLEPGLWQILSRSGHVVYESADGDYVRAVCRGWRPQVAAATNSTRRRRRPVFWME